ncbi:MAG: GNAT family N-acetyltransferase [Chitinophagales bacterium]
MPEIYPIHDKETLLRCLPVIQSLRPHLHADNIHHYLDAMQRQDYHMRYCMEDDKPAAFMGFRFITHFYSGNIIYVDDLVTFPVNRGKGFAGALLDHVIELAKEKGLDGVRLDSGHHRHDAHRLYLNKGFVIASHHFNYKIREPK